MEGEDEDLTAAMEAEVGELMDSNPDLIADLVATFGTASPTVTQQWIGFGLAQNTAEVDAIVQPRATNMDMDEEAEAQDGEAEYGEAEDEEAEGEEEEAEYEEDVAQFDSGLTAGELTAGARVLLVNPLESFYGDVGTVAGPSRATGCVRVTFDSKTSVTYDVPAADLDLYRDAAQVDELLKTTDGPWIINGLPALVRLLRANEGRRKWALTGSIALSYWARQYGVPFRHPHDIDIVVDDLFWWHQTIAEAVGVSARPAGPDANHKTVQLSMGRVDIIADGKGLGEFGSGPHIVDGMPVVGLQTIGHYKRRRGEDKDIEDLQVVDLLIRRQNAEQRQ